MRKILFFLVFTLLLSASCKKKTETPSTRPLLMTVDVAGTYFNQTLGGVIFISDMKGKVLADTFCQADGVYRLYGQAGTSAPSLMEVTIVRSELYWHSFAITLETYTCIQPSEWKLQGYRATLAGQVNPVYKNIPAHNDAILVSSSGYSNLTFTLGLPIELYKNTDDIYFEIPTSSGMKYKWFSGIQVNTSDTFDLSNPLVPDRKTITFPSPVQYYECRIQGFPDGNVNSPIPYLLDELLGNGTIANSVEAYYPPAKFPVFHSDISTVESYASNQTWYYHTDGDIPAAFKKISAGLVSFSSTNTSLNVKASGSLDATAGTWQFLSPYQGLVNWTVFGPDTATFLQLPQVAPALTNMFPWFSRDSLVFANVRLIDFVNSQGYPQMISLLYNPSNPSNFDRQETTMLEQLPPSKRLRR